MHILEARSLYVQFKVDRCSPLVLGDLHLLYITPRRVLAQLLGEL